MKNILNYILVSALIITISGCSDFLELTPQGSENSDNFFTEKENGVRAINGIYDLLQLDEGNGPDGQWMSHHHDFFIGDILSDDSEKGSNDGDYAEFRDLVEFQLKPTQGMSISFWVHGFWGVSRCNYALDNLQKVSWDPALRDRLTGEALFLRGYFYWYLVRIYGGVPVFTSTVKPSEFGKVKRASLNEVYGQIAADLKDAVKLLPEKSAYQAADMGRATKGAARALLARVYMYQIGTDIQNTTVSWQQVYEQTDAIIKSGEYALMPNYAALLETENKNNVESIFEIQMAVGTTGNAPGSVGTNFYNFQGNRKDDSGWGFNNPTIDLFNAFDPTDPRLSCVVYGENFNNGILYGVKRKYDRLEQGTDWLNRKAALPVKPAIAKASDRNLRIIRFADVLLMHAEASYYLGKAPEAQTMLNRVRERARNSSYCMGYAEGKMDYSAAPTSVNLPNITSSGQQLLLDIWKERRLELAMEQLRFYDLVRTGRFIDAMDIEKNQRRVSGQPYASLFAYPNIKANALARSIDGPNGNKIPLLPIPQTEVEAWGLEQNKGY
jgi:starch-binding outer membrane protein, SusD/RagB family